MALSIKISNLTKKYGPQTAIDNISLSVSKGEIIGLLGPNGAGKSTLMKSITSVINFDKGAIEVNGFDVKINAKESKKQIGFLPENNPLYTEMYVKEYLSFVANIHKISHSEIEKVIEKVGLSLEKNKKIHQLSKGYKQRVGIAQAILSNPEILILDEPTNGLDPNQILEIRALISELGKEKTIILSTHIMQEVEALCTRVILLNKGKISQDCSIDEFKGKYSSLEQAFFEYTKV